MKNQKGNAIGEFLSGLVLALAVGGWIANVVKLCNTPPTSPVRIKTVVRLFGILVPPIGSAMGFVPND